MQTCLHLLWCHFPSLAALARQCDAKTMLVVSRSLILSDLPLFLHRRHLLDVLLTYSRHQLRDLQGWKHATFEEVGSCA